MSEPVIDLKAKAESIDNAFGDMFGEILSNNEFREKKTDNEKKAEQNKTVLETKPKESTPVSAPISEIPKEAVPQPQIKPTPEPEPETIPESKTIQEEAADLKNNQQIEQKEQDASANIQQEERKKEFFNEVKTRPNGRKANIQEIERIKKDPEVFIIFHEPDKPKNRMIPEERKEKSLSEQAEMSRKASENTSLLDGEMCYKLERMDDKEIIVLNKPVIKIGKSNKFADYVITGNTAVSRRHAELISKNGKCYVRDKNSTNGTFIDGLQLPPESEMEIKSGQTLTIANVNFRFL